MEETIARKLCCLSFLVVIGAVYSSVAENGFHHDLETSLKAYFGEIESNKTTTASVAESETKVEDDRWKRSPIYTANLPSYVADKYNGGKKLVATRARGESYGKPEGYKKGNPPSNDKYVRKGPVMGYKKKPLKEAEYGAPPKRRRPLYAGPKADKNHKAAPTYDRPVAPSTVYKGPGMKARPQVGYGANKKARPVAGGYGPSKRPKAQYVPSGKGQGKPAPYGPSNNSDNYKQRPTYNRTKKPPQKKGPYGPRPRKTNYPGQKCPYSGRCKKIPYRPGYGPSRPLPAYYKPKQSGSGEQAPYYKPDTYEPSLYEKPAEMKPTYEPEQKKYEEEKPYEPEPEYKPEYEAGESYQQPEPQYEAEEPKPEYGTVEPYHDQPSPYKPEPVNEYAYDAPPPDATSYDAQQESAPAPVDYGTEQTYQQPEQSVAYGEPNPSGGYENPSNHEEEGNSNPGYETPAQAGGPYEDGSANYGEDQQMYDQQPVPMPVPEEYSEHDQYSTTPEGSGNEEPAAAGYEGPAQQQYDGNPYSNQYEAEAEPAAAEDYQPPPPPPWKQNQPALYDLKYAKGNAAQTARAGLYDYGGLYGLPRVIGSSDSDDTDSDDWRRRNRDSSGSGDSDMDDDLDDVSSVSAYIPPRHRYRYY